jgi:hypothetical protein
MGLQPGAVALLKQGLDVLWTCNVRQAANDTPAQPQRVKDSMPLEQAGPTPEELTAENLASMSFIDSSTEASPAPSTGLSPAAHVIAAVVWSSTWSLFVCRHPDDGCEHVHAHALTCHRTENVAWMAQQSGWRDSVLEQQKDLSCLIVDPGCG